MATFKPQGKPHAMLERLVAHDAGFDELSRVAGSSGAQDRKRMWHVVGALLQHELVGGRRARYYLLPAGRQALDALRAGQEVTLHERVTSVRVFA